MVAIFKLCGLVVRLNIKTIGNIGEVGVDFAIYLLLCIGHQIIWENNIFLDPVVRELLWTLTKISRNIQCEI